MDAGTTGRGDGVAAAAGLSPTMRRTATFLAAGVAALLLGAAVQPRLRSRSVEPEAERVLFPELSDAAKAASLEIVSFDDELATLKPFKVVQSGGVWSLPSHDNYPADAKDQLASAATELVDRPILDVVSTSPGDHETFGVIEPDAEKIKVGMTGVGQLVEIRDASGNKLARLIIGKEDKRPASGAGAGRTLRFVRKAGQDPVYRVELDTSKFTTKFDDWIEKDLLKLSPWDVRKLTLDDYTCSFGADEASGRLMVSQARKSRIDLAYDDKDSKWSLAKLEAFDKDNKPREEKPAAEEELASAKLNDLRNALGDLKIIDVARKPSGLSGDLRAAEKFTNDREAVTSLAQRGFYPFSSGDILSSNGETIVGMKDGVEYVLRFGNPASVAGEAKAEPPKDGKAKDAGETSGRYLFVMARFNESLLTKPQLEPLPEVPALPAGEPKPEGQPKAEGKPNTEAKPAPGAATPAPGETPKPGDSPKPAETPKPEADEKKAEDAKTQTTTKESEAGGEESGKPADSKAEPAKPDTTKPDAVKPQSTQADATKPDAAKADAAKPDAPKPDAAEQLKKAEEAEAKAQQALEERRRVERENRRKQDEYDDSVKAAQKRVRELNNRFADWYYIVSDAEFAKIHLGRDAVFQKKEKPAEQKPEQK
jgi:hypothetical protein